MTPDPDVMLQSQRGEVEVTESRLCSIHQQVFAPKVGAKNISLNSSLRRERALKGRHVQRLNGYFIYQVGAALRPLTSVSAAMKNQDVRPLLWGGEYWLRQVLSQSLINLKTSRATGWELVKSIEEAKNKLDGMDAAQLMEELGFLDAYLINSKATEFQTLLSAELSMADVYVVSKKGGYDLTELAENGLCVFPKSLADKVPSASEDARQAARCIAFELPTAAAFHLHRVLERVLKKYYDIATGNKPHPDRSGIGAYIDALKNNQIDDKIIFSALADIKRFHRDPVMHPQDSLDTSEDALALLGTINSAITYMLKSLPDPELNLVG